MTVDALRQRCWTASRSRPRTAKPTRIDRPESVPPRRKASCTGKPSARFPTDLGGLVPIASEPIRRLGFASPLGRDPSRTTQRIIEEKSRRPKPELLTLHKTGTFHFAPTLRASPLTLTHRHDRYTGHWRVPRCP